MIRFFFFVEFSVGRELNALNLFLGGSSDDKIGFLNSWRYGFKCTLGVGLMFDLFVKARDRFTEDFLCGKFLGWAWMLRTGGFGTWEVLIGFMVLYGDSSNLLVGLKTLLNDIAFLIGFVIFTCEVEICSIFPILTGFTFIPHSRFFRFFSRNPSLFFLR